VAINNLKTDDSETEESLNLEGNKKLLSKLDSMKVSMDEVEQLHNDVVKLSNNYNITNKIITNNISELERLASQKDDNTVVLGILDEIKNMKNENDIAKRFVNRENVSNEEMKKLISSMENSSKVLDELIKQNGAIKINISDLTSNVSDNIMNDNIDGDTRQQQLESLLNVLQKNSLDGDSPELMNELININKDIKDGNKSFNQEVASSINANLQKMAEQQRVNNTQLEYRADENDSQLEDFMLSQKSFMDTMESEIGDYGTKGRDALEENAEIFSKGKELSEGVMSYAFNAVGLGGLDQLFGLSDKMALFTNKSAGKLAGKSMSLLKSASGSLMDIFSPKKAGKSILGKMTGGLLGKSGGGLLGKSLGKSLLKKIPGIGLLSGLAFGASKLMKGDFLGGLGEVGSGALSLIPGIGTAASIALDTAMGARDIKKESKMKPVSTEIASLNVNRGIDKSMKPDAPVVQQQPIIIQQPSDQPRVSTASEKKTGIDEMSLIALQLDI